MLLTKLCAIEIDKRLDEIQTECISGNPLAKAKCLETEIRKAIYGLMESHCRAFALVLSIKRSQKKDKKKRNKIN